MADYSDAMTGDLGIVPGTTGNADPASAWPLAGDTGLAYGMGTGQNGITPAVGGGGNVSHAITGLWDWLNTPFKVPMSPVTLTLIVGVIIIAILFWNFILYHIRIAAEAI